MNVIHLLVGSVLFFVLAITMILAILGLALMEDCVINNECTIKHTPSESELVQSDFDVLWIMMGVLPITTMVFMMYFILFTKPDFKFPNLKKEKKE